MDNKQWHGGKGSKRRNSDDTLYADNWEKIFGQKKPEISVRKETPKHAQSKIHKDHTKVIPRKYKYNNEEQI